MPLPWSQLYKDAVDKVYDLPSDYAGYSFHSYNTKPMPTKHLSPEEVLQFRDDAFVSYHTYPPFLDKVKSKYGEGAVDIIKEMASVRLKRKILNDLN